MNIMAKSDVPRTNLMPYIVAVVIFVLIAVGFAYLYMQKANVLSQEAAAYGNLNSNYSIFKTQSQNQILTLQNQLSNVSKKYNATENNLTTPYSEVLYYQKTLNLPKYNESISPFNDTYDYSTGSYSYYATDNFTWGRFNISFNAPYPGYIVFNGTSTLSNKPSACAWTIYESDKISWRNSTIVSEVLSGSTFIYTDRFLGNDRLFINLTSTPWVELCPMQSVTYLIPVNKGENYLFIDNDNSTQGQTITFSAKYVGFHTS